MTTPPSLTVSVVVPVKDGGPLLAELLVAVAEQGPEEVLVVDSGSRDGSADVARRHGATVVEIDPRAFKHGPTRNLAAEQTTGDVIAFLTQDATPAPGWLDAIRAAFAADPDLGVAYGPHLPRPDTSPMVARELTEYFATFEAEGGGPRVFAPGDPTFLSNVNAAYRRACWEEIRFEDLAYSEDQAFGRAVAVHPRWHKRYDPAIAVLHAHDYPPGEFFKRYFDEYRGLAETVDHHEEIHPLHAVRDSLARARADAAWVGRQGATTPEQLKVAARATTHHLGRRVAAVLGSRAATIPDPIERRLSLEGRASTRDATAARAAGADQPVATHPGERKQSNYEHVVQSLRKGEAALTADGAQRAEREQLHVAVVIPWFRIGSGGHMTIFRLVEQLESKGHTCTLWLDDPLGYNPEGAAVLRRTIQEHFRPLNAPVFKGFSGWFGADVVVATGWQTAYTVRTLPGCGARAYLVQDREPDFYPASAEHHLAEDTYRFGFHGIAASPWLADMVRGYGGTSGHFDLAADHDVYYPRDGITRESATVAFYARAETPRRGVTLGALALEEVVRARPATRIVTFGTRDAVGIDAPSEAAGVLDADALARLYSQATVGVCLSLTNYSLIPGEMLACGLPCVDVDHPSAVGVFGDDGPVAFSRPDILALAEVIGRLLDDPAERDRRRAAGLAFAEAHTWERSGRQVEAELRTALRLAGAPD
ncbi:MAG: glycosyltransferase [Solirubrobacteraceae bacterium]|nr:glycosyltransferase [Solirubrobacteraceae bacterium]